MRGFGDRRRGSSPGGEELEEVEVEFTDDEEEVSEGEEESEEEEAVVARPVSGRSPRGGGRRGLWGRRDGGEDLQASAGERVTMVTTGGRATPPAGLRQEVESYVWAVGLFDCCSKGTAPEGEAATQPCVPYFFPTALLCPCLTLGSVVSAVQEEQHLSPGCLQIGERGAAVGCVTCGFSLCCAPCIVAAFQRRQIMRKYNITGSESCGKWFWPACCCAACALHQHALFLGEQRHWGRAGQGSALPLSTSVAAVPPSDMSMQRNALFDEGNLEAGTSRVGGVSVVEMAKGAGNRWGRSEEEGRKSALGRDTELNESVVSAPWPKVDRTGSMLEDSNELDNSGSEASSSGSEEEEETRSVTPPRTPGNNFWDGILSPSDQQSQPALQRNTPPRVSRQTSRRSRASTMRSSTASASSSSNEGESAPQVATPSRNYWDGIFDEVDGSGAGGDANLVSLREKAGATSTSATPTRGAPPPPPPLPEERPQRSLPTTAREPVSKGPDAGSSGSEAEMAPDEKTKIGVMGGALGPFRRRQRPTSGGGTLEANPVPERRTEASVEDKPKKLSLKERLTMKKVGKKDLQVPDEPPPSMSDGVVASSGGSGMRTLEDALAEKEGRAPPPKPKPEGPAGFSAFGNPLALDMSASSEEPVPHDTADVLTFSPLASSLGSSVPPSPLSTGLSGRAAGVIQPQMSPMSLSPNGRGLTSEAGKPSVTEEATGSDSNWDSSEDEDTGAADTTTDSFVY